MKTLVNPIILPTLNKVIVLHGVQDALNQKYKYIVAIGYLDELNKFKHLPQYESEHEFSGNEYLQIITSSDPASIILQKAKYDIVFNFVQE